MTKLIVTTSGILILVLCGTDLVCGQQPAPPRSGSAFFKRGPTDLRKFKMPEFPDRDKTKGKIAASSDGTAEATEDMLSEPESELNETKATGDWNGIRTKWEEKGYQFELSWTNFWQGVSDGGLRHRMNYGGKFIGGIKIDGTKAGLFKNSIIKMGGEFRYEDSATRDVGAAIPVNTALISPGEEGAVLGVNEFNYTQLFIRDKGLNIYAFSVGKFDTLDLFDDPFQGLSGIPKFFNLNQNGPVTAGRTVPIVTNGATFAWIRKGQPFFTLALFDPKASETRAGISDLFSAGITIAPGVILQSNFFGKTGRHSFSGAITTRKYTPFDQIPQVIVPNPANPVVPKGGSWFVAYTLTQYLVQDEKDKTSGWGLFGTFSIADERTNPIRSQFTVGIGGNRLFRRSRDRFGISYSYIGFSDTLKDALEPLIRIRAENQFEAFYNWSIRPWLWLTGDLQIVSPLRRNVDMAVIPGARLQIIF